MPRVACEIVDVYVFRMGAGGGIEFLSLRRSAGRYLGGTWQAVHGRIEAGETAWQAGLRELREETGFVPRAFYQIDTVNTFYIAASDVVHHCPCFAAEVVADGVVVLNDEHDDFRWIPADEAGQHFIWPGQRRAVREIMEEIVARGPAVEHLRIQINDAEQPRAE